MFDLRGTTEEKMSADKAEIPSGGRSINANFFAGNIDTDNLRLKLNKSSTLNSSQTEDLIRPVIN